MAIQTAANPLLQDSWLPPFPAIRPEHVEPAIREIITANLAAVEDLAGLAKPDWDCFVQPLHELNDRLERAWAPVSHLNAVKQDEALRAAHDACLPLLSDYYTRLGQHQGLYRAYKAMRGSSAWQQLSQAQRKVIENALRDFRLSGIELPQADRQRYAAIVARLSDLSSRFANQVLDATQAWAWLVNDEAELEGLPASALDAAHARAAAKGQDGYLLTLDAPCYLAVMTHAVNRSLRQTVYEAYVTRASEVGPHACQFDNGPVIEEILSLRQELASLLGFVDYAAYSLATKMADSPQQVADFLRGLVRRARPVAEQERDTLCEFAREAYGYQDVYSWDVAWLSERLREQRHALDQEQIREYFPLDRVLEGLFRLVGRLFGVSIEPDPAAPAWHADASCYRLYRDGQVIAAFYLDLYAREHKRGGAWMGDCRVRRIRSDGSVQLPVAFLTCNFTAPTAERPSLLTFDDVTTLFHEFGHGLHHMLTRVDYPPVAGINGVEWDAVELPSQFLENWCWQPAVIPLISSHYLTGNALPVEWLERMLAARNFQSGMQMVRQLEFALFDLVLHQSQGRPVVVRDVLGRIREEVAVFLLPAWNRFENSFTHIFAGGYAAGYYSYKWAEVLSADAFAAFEEVGIMDDATSQRFLTEVLERGGTEEAIVLFQRFRGREPDMAALLRHSGLEAGEAA